MLSKEDRVYFDKLVEMESCVPQNIINIKRRRDVETYKELYEIRVAEYKLLEEAKDKLVEYEPIDIVKIMGITNSTDDPVRYRREYQRVAVFFRSLYGDVKTLRTVERCRFYLSLIEKKSNNEI